jgi:hypothetical protein
LKWEHREEFSAPWHSYTTDGTTVFAKLFNKTTHFPDVLAGCCGKVIDPSDSLRMANFLLKPSASDSEEGLCCKE